MRVMVRMKIPTETGNEAIRSGKMAKVVSQIMADLKPEAAYFYVEGEGRTAIAVVELKDASEIAGIVEKCSLGMGAHVEMFPVMNAEDLQKGLSGLGDILKNYG